MRRIVHGAFLEEPGYLDVVLGVEESFEVSALALEARTVQLKEGPLPGNANDDVAILIPACVVVPEGVNFLSECGGGATWLWLDLLEVVVLLVVVAIPKLRA